MHQILHLPIVTLTLLFACQALFAAPPSEFLLTNPDGTIKIKGIYTRSDDGNVSRYDVYDAHEKLLYSEIPYYAPDGRIIRADRLDPTGTPMAVIVYLEDKAVELDTSGKVVSTNAFTQDPYLQSKKAEQGAAANP